jgi:hypothetical protein
LDISDTTVAQGLRVTTNYSSGATNYGVRVIAQGGTSTNYGGTFLASNGPTGNIGVFGNASGPANSTNYGVRAYASGGSNNYGIYSEADKNYFSGNVGIGTDSPGAKLDISNTNMNQGLKVSTSYSATWNYGGNFSASNGSSLNVGLASSASGPAGSTNYGISVSASGGSTNYGIYSSADKNYFSGNVGIGTDSHGAKLEVAGQIKITGGSPGAGKVLTSDSSGLASWQTPGTFSLKNPGGTTLITAVSECQWAKCNSYSPPDYSGPAGGSCSATAQDNLVICPSGWYALSGGAWTSAGTLSQSFPYEGGNYTGWFARTYAYVERPTVYVLCCH